MNSAPRLFFLIAFLSSFSVFARGASAQPINLDNCHNLHVSNLTASQFKILNERGELQPHAILTGSSTAPVHVECDEMQLFADNVEVFQTNQVVATGNVVFVSGGNRITADRMEFDTKTRTGAFFNAAGTVSLANRVDKSLFGTQEPDAYFRGEEIHKLGPDKYKIVHGAFTTCVQPTPRWEMVGGQVTLTVNDHALLTNSILRVKGVPLMYLPIFYYPIEEDDRSTGFLIPTWGTSNVRGQTFSNAFFWAIDRSQDATFMHDWFSKTGQGYGGEYRYELGRGNRGTTKMYVLNEHETQYRDATGALQTTKPKKSFQMNGGLTQALGAGLHARADVNYYTDIAVNQRYQQNFNAATQRTRNIGGNISGNWNAYGLSATLQRGDFFYGDDSFTRNGSMPRITFARAERPIGKSKMYFGVNTEYVAHVYENVNQGKVLDDRGLTRLDVNPVMRLPFTKWQFLTVNSTVSWRGTYWTESLDPNHVQVSEGLGRKYFDLQARVTGPVLNRIWSPPAGQAGTKWKHVIEPAFTIQRTTGLDMHDRIVQIDPVDQIPLGVTKLIYGVNNRLYAKHDVSREVLSVTVNQTYYSQATASQFDPNYQSSLGSAASKFSAVRIQTRVSPSARFQGDFSTEWHPIPKTFTTFTATGIFNGRNVQTTGGWTERRLIPELPNFSNPALATHDITASTTIHDDPNHLGGTYSLAYDLRNNDMRQQRIVAYYNAQCCGVAVEFQTYDIGGYSQFVVPKDTRFNISFTLAGIGTFSNFFGAFGQGH
jgi:LPS-assembly protein